MSVRAKRDWKSQPKETKCPLQQSQGQGSRSCTSRCSRISRCSRKSAAMVDSACSDGIAAIGGGRGTQKPRGCQMPEGARQLSERLYPGRRLERGSPITGMRREPHCSTAWSWCMKPPGEGSAYSRNLLSATSDAICAYSWTLLCQFRRWGNEGGRLLRPDSPLWQEDQGCRIEGIRLGYAGEAGLQGHQSLDALQGASRNLVGLRR